MKKPWPFNPQYIRIHIRNPNKVPRSLNQVLTLRARLPDARERVGSQPELKLLVRCVPKCRRHKSILGRVFAYSSMDLIITQ